MSREEKLIRRFRSRPRDFTWDDLTRLLESLGYRESRSGRTGGSRRRFVHETAPAISLHRPHPGNLLKGYAVTQVLRVLEEEGLL